MPDAARMQTVVPAPLTGDRPSTTQTAPSFIDDYLRAGYTVERVGTFYSVFDLLFAVREIEDAGGKVCIKLYRDKTGRPDGIELARLVEKKDQPTLALAVPVRCPVCDRPKKHGEEGECNVCALEFDTDFGPGMAGHINYGSDVDPFGGAA